MNQQEQILERYRKLKIPVPISDDVLIESSVPTSNKSVYETINKIKNGSKRDEFSQVLKKESPASKFKELPVPKPKKNPNQKKTESPEIETFNTNKEVISEFDIIEKMFETGSSKHQVKYSDIDGYNNNIQVDESQIRFPSMDIEEQLKQRLQKKAASSKEQNIQLPTQKTINKEESINMNTYEAIEVMRKIARDEAKEVVETILKEFIGNQKNKKTYEIVDGKKGIIKIGDKKYQLKNYTES